MDPALRQEIEGLRKLTTKQLQARFRELFGEDSPSSNHQHLFRRIAWRLQARADGDLSQRARERAEELAVDVDLRLRAPRRFWRELTSGAVDGAESSVIRDGRIPPVGTVLRRSYQGRQVLVSVLENGFLYNDQTYSSLSAVAYRATGTRWNGFLFFGLMKSKP